MANPTTHASTETYPNPLGTDGFDFVEFAAPDPELLHKRCSRPWASPRSPPTSG